MFNWTGLLEWIAGQDCWTGLLRFARKTGGMRVRIEIDITDVNIHFMKS